MPSSTPPVSKGRFPRSRTSLRKRSPRSSRRTSPTEHSVPSIRIGVDTGGTFTDLVVIDDETGARRTVKVPSTLRQPARAVFEALRRSGVPPAEIGFFVLGTTIATNSLLERKGQRVIFLTTQGFE